ncbi:General transcription factor IIE subunit 1 [Geodia barretti]|uniref:General transcription factor IIE subunit 1 n=1 Tax=Geodia barretti TaxID=519541 RepID=A0AA35SB29_GEOBA|nr:General transcription factor IIE subunit 1 [Geodia barretti]
MSSHEILNEVPLKLKVLVRVIARAFYQPQQIVVLDILAKYPCVTEGDLLDVLKLHGAQKQLRQVLNSLKKDKLIRSLQKMENEEGETRADGQKLMRMTHYYFINYKQFVNVVKYRLDHMRRKLEMEEKNSKSHTSYKCPHCAQTFSDLDVDRLIDHTTGSLNCSHCGCALEEEEPEDAGADSRQLMSQLNAQLRPILDLLREVENINLSPEILEPELHSIQQHLQSCGVVSGKSGGKNQELGWNSKQAVDLYGGDQTISVSIGSEQELKKKQKAAAKDVPEWMKYSTVHPSGDHAQDPASTDQLSDTVKTDAPSSALLPDQQIMNELLLHEAGLGALPGGLGGAGPSTASSSSKSPTPGGELHRESSSSEGEEEEKGGWAPAQAIPENSGDESSDEEFTMKVGGREVALNEVTDEMVANMTAEERQTYTTLCQQAMSQLY